MPRVDLSQFPSPIAQWFQRDPTLAVETGLSTAHSYHGTQDLEDLTPAGLLLFGEGGMVPHLIPNPAIGNPEAHQLDLEVRAWMMLEEGWSRKSTMERTLNWATYQPFLAFSYTWRLFYPAPIPPSVCKTVHHFLALSGFVVHRTAAGFMSKHNLTRTLVPKDVTPVEHRESRAGPGEMQLEVPKAPFHPHVCWTL